MPFLGGVGLDGHRLRRADSVSSRRCANSSTDGSNACASSRASRCWTRVIAPATLQSLVRNSIEKHIDREALEGTKRVEEQERETLE